MIDKIYKQLTRAANLKEELGLATAFKEVRDAMAKVLDLKRGRLNNREGGLIAPRLAYWMLG